MRRWRALESVGMDSGDGKCGKWNFEDWRHSENPDLGEAAAAGCLRVHRGRARVNVSGRRQANANAVEMGRCGDSET